MDVKEVEESYETLWKLYVFAPPNACKRVGNVCESMFRIKNEFIPQEYDYIETLDKWMKR
jgi:hypothetical protein